MNTLAANGLLQMFDAGRQLFCYRLRRTERGLVREGISHRYTMIALLGLQRLEDSGVSSPIRTRPVVEGLLENPEWIDNIGDLGLLLWVCALAAPERLANVERRLEVRTALSRFPDARQGRTMELSWFLSGLSHGTSACPAVRRDVEHVAVETYEILRHNQGDRGIFGHLTRGKSIAGMIRSEFGSFADQVYPIYALTKFAQAYNCQKAVEGALDCALSICRAQGSYGQWWWHYDSSTARVIESYPVYSVHQEGMGPMALFALGEATKTDFSPWIYRGLDWITGNNELGFDMRDSASNLVWRCVFRPTVEKYWNVALSVLTDREDRASASLNGLRILFECRPYELGWLLYAFARPAVFNGARMPSELLAND